MSEQLALLGGNRAVTHGQPRFVWPILTDATDRAVLRQMRDTISIYDRSGVFARFEDAWSARHKRSRSLLTNSGTSALHSVYVGADLKRGDQVIAPAYTFHATVSPLFQAGAVPVLADCDATGNIDCDHVEALIGSRTRAVVVTHMWGVPADMPRLSSICARHGLMLFEDCSHAHGATYGGNPVGGKDSTAAAWSLQGQKIITGGEGGILSTDDDRLYHRATLFGHYNKRCVKEIPRDSDLQRFAVTGMGLKLRAHPLAIAMAEEQLGHLDGWLREKRRFARIMSERFGKLRGLRAPVVPEGCDPAWYAFVLQYQPEELDGLPVERFHAALLAEGAVEADLPGSTCPLSWFPLYQEPHQLFPDAVPEQPCYKRGQFPTAERFSSNAIKLPVWVNPEDGEVVEQYIAAFEKVVGGYKQLL
ncbi:MAG: aminotransferase class I/II-fold pyridoxal phosphate-dependent enzyme [Candidatus Obscuribacterales bacterium]|nr:aminotransferase class I/II-fold pyridoxal phosphate-dependent enzyme [Candidatus Obscuribacterales bacterium]